MNESPEGRQQPQQQQQQQHCILALYKFVTPKLAMENLAALKKKIEFFCLEHQVRGSLLLAPEGINGTISYPLLHTTTTPRQQPEDDDDEKDPVRAFLLELFPGLRTRLSYSPDGHVFYRLKIKVKKEILTCRVPTAETDTENDNNISTDKNNTTPTTNNLCLDPTQQVGQYVQPGPEWDALLQDPDCLVVDARNDYEVRLGTFHNAQNPQTQIFSELLPWMKERLQQQKPKKVAMFCTGGIRCEKATAAAIDLVQQQLQEQQQDNDNIPVYHLEGGILAYLDTVPSDHSQFEGACYVFDQRVAVTHGLQPVPHMTMCHACRAPLTREQQDGHVDFIPGKQCTYCVSHPKTAKQQQRYEARQHQIQLAQQKGWLHIHDPKEKVLTVLAETGKQKHRQKPKLPIEAATKEPL